MVREHAGTKQGYLSHPQSLQMYAAAMTCSCPRDRATGLRFGRPVLNGIVLVGR